MDWEQRLAAIWERLDELDEDEFVAAIDAHAEELDGEDPVGLFERGAARDSTGHPMEAVEYYRAALERGLTGIRRRRAVIQMASSIRNLGRPQESVQLLTAELRQPADELDDAVRGFLALALADVGREREAVALALQALAPHLPRYQRSLGNYARDLLD
jgi:hypothetical protein